MVLEKNGNDIPEQLSKDFFKKALENGLKLSNINISKVSFTMGSRGGDNYSSLIYRALVTYSVNGLTKDISLIIKYMPIDGSREVLGSMQVYEREASMYFDIVPEFEKLLGNIVLAPKCFYAAAEPVQTIVFEDLTVGNYEVADRITGLDEEYSKILLSKIGKFHAASMVLAKKNPESMKFFHRSMFHDDTESKVKDEVFIGTLQYLEKLLSTWPGFESIGIKIGKIKEHFYDICLKVVSPRKDGFSVLNHGDLWVNNFMFKKNNNGEPIDVALIDLQMSYFGSLGIDINYFLNTSVRIDILKSKRYELIRFYYTSLNEALENMNYPEIPSWDQIRKEIFTTEFYGFFSFACVLPLVSLDRETSKDNSFESLEDAEKSKKNRELSFSSKRMQEALKYSLDRFNELGVLDLHV